jgi:capsid assembly protease
MQRAELIALVNTMAWAMRPELLAAMLADVVSGQVQPEAAVRPATVQGAVQVIPVLGPISQRGGGLFEMFFGGTSVERVGKALTAALQDGSIGAIVLDIDSPGGSVRGVPELAEAIHAARGSKPIVALANSVAASAAYWLGSAATELMVTPSGEVGSIGVWAAHIDYSKELEEMGETVTLISAGKYKVEGNPYQPLGEDARDYMQGQIDDYYGMFLKAVARNRGVDVEQARGEFGEGRMVMAKPAQKAGMVDGIGGLDDAILRAARLAKPARRDDARARAAITGL